MSDAALVGDILRDYALRGVFRGFSAASGRRVTAARAEYQTRWHRDQVFCWQFDGARASLRVPCVLPQVPVGSAMYRDFKCWLRERQSPSLPEHRRYDANRLRLKTYNRRGEIALTAHILDGDTEHAVRKLVDLVNEIYLSFLSSGLYYEWLLDTFDLDPDRPY